jgi:hypothetical protein
MDRTAQIERAAMMEYLEARDLFVTRAGDVVNMEGAFVMPLDRFLNDFMPAIEDYFARTLTAFDSMADMLNQPAGYRPTLRPDLGLTYEFLADRYDLAQALRGDPRRAYRGADKRRRIPKTGAAR